MRKSSGKAERRFWDKSAFLDTLKSRSDQSELRVAEHILNWAESRNLRIAWGRGSSDRAFFAMLDLDEVTRYTFAVRTGWKSAYSQLKFAQCQRSFDTLEKRRELANRIQEATGAILFDETLKKYPGIKLGILDQDKLQDLLEVFERYIEQCKSPQVA